MDLNQTKTLEEWKEFLDISGLKLTTLEAEASELGEWITPFVKDDLDWLDAVLNDVEYKLYSALLKSYRENRRCERNDFSDCNDFSDFIAFLSSFKEVFNRKIADVDHLVNGNQGSPIGLMLEATAKAKAGNNI